MFYPVSVLPAWTQYVSHILPPAYVFEGMRAIVAGKEPSTPALLFSIVLAALYILLACLAFMRVYRYALKTGLIARYSAETLS